MTEENLETITFGSEREESEMAEKSTGCED